MWDSGGVGVSYDMRVATRDLLSAAFRDGYAVGAFNVFTAEEVAGLFAGASRACAPVIVQTTPAARRYLGVDLLVGMVGAAERAHPDVVFSLHLDHGTAAHCSDAIESGDYSSVMIDASREPFEANVAATEQIVRRAHGKGIAVEAELGMVGGKEDDLAETGPASAHTDPREAKAFAETTGCDSLAVAVGTRHGAFKHVASGRLDLEALGRIHATIPAMPLVLHGASSVPADEVARINAAGGRLEAASGIDDSDLERAVGLGVSKVNVATDARLVWTRVHREAFASAPDLIDPIVPGAEFIEAYAALVEARCRLFGSAGLAGSL